MIRISKEQLEKEKELQDIVELYIDNKIHRKEANKRMGDLLKKSLSQKIFSQKDISSYNYRRDPKNKRNHIDFALCLRNSHIKEKETFKYFFKWFVDNKKRDATYELLGSDDNGYVMIVNFWKRFDSPIKPDYRISWKNKSENIEVKNFAGNEIWLKIDNVKKYNEWKSFIVINFKGKYWLFRNNVNSYLLNNMPFSLIKKYGKPSVVINENGKKAHFKLQDLINKKFVKEIL